MRCVDLYNQTQSKWFEEMVTTSMVKPLKSKLILMFCTASYLTAQKIHFTLNFQHFAERIVLIL